MKKVVVAVDSFKGSLSSHEVAEAFALGFREQFPQCELVQVGLADGGEGTARALVDMLQGEWVEVEAHDPLMRPIRAGYGLLDGGSTAVIEMAAASGLPLVSDAPCNALATTSYGTGELIRSALARGCRRLLIGLGGSATTDGGVGMLAALGYRFYDRSGVEFMPLGGGCLEQIATIDGSHAHPSLAEVSLIAACDVTNPLYGPEGAAFVFAPQKGASPDEVALLDRGLRHYDRLLETLCGYPVAAMSGAGAAGGLGAGLCGVLKARPVRGVDMVLDAIAFDRLIEGADLVVTGEGRMDCQTVMGKAPQGVLQRARRQQIPVVAICGSLVWCEALEQAGFAALFPVVAGPVSLAEAMQPEVARENVRRTASQIARMCKLSL